MKYTKDMGFESKILFSILLIVIVCIQGLNSTLHCYRCLNLDCPGSKDTCQEVRSFLVSQLRQYYFLEEELEPCPAIDDVTEWRLRQLGGPCCDNDAECRHVTCTLGRLRVISQLETSASNMVSHGTVLGCAKERLLAAIRDANVQHNSCDLKMVNETVKFASKHYLALEHCNQRTDSCYESDYCIPFEQSVVRTFKDANERSGFDFGLMVGIIVVIVIIILAIMGASMCWGPLNKAHNFSKPTEPVAFTGFSDIEASRDATSSAALVPQDSLKSPIGSISNGPAAVPVPIPARPERKSSYI